MTREFQMAMWAASYCWHGTSMVEGAIAILGQVYAPHEFCGDDKDCTRCGQPEDGELHR